MARMTLITGGARSGKSTFGEKLIGERSKTVAYIATAIAFDSEMKDRIAKHQAQRPDHWMTYENWKTIQDLVPTLDKQQDGVILDCLTILVTNWMLEAEHIDWDRPNPEEVNALQGQILDYVKGFLMAMRETSLEIVLITNELGMGIVPENPLARAFRDIAGRVNQLAASLCDEVYLTVCGQSLKIK